MSTKEPLAEANEVTKRFDQLVALDRVNFSINPGEIHALLGENGAGKTTLANILYGMLRPDSGRVLVDSKPVVFNSPRDALQVGIAMVHQHFTLIPVLSVVENIVLGVEPVGRLQTLDYESAKNQTAQVSKQWGLPVVLDAKVSQLSVGERQRVEILKALYRGAKVLILDEPTAVLTPPEVDGLFEALKRFTSQGGAVLFITHKLDEVMRMANTVTVLRKGKLMDSVSVADTTKQELAKLMVGKEVLFNIERPKSTTESVVYQVTDLWVTGDHKVPVVKGITFNIRKNEIVGMAGVAGNGQRELSEALIGVRKAVKGSITLDDETVTNQPPWTTRSRGLAFVPEDKEVKGVIGDMTIAENIMLHIPRSDSLKSPVFLNKKAIKEFAEKLVAEYEVKTPGIDAMAKTLSGGNMQKLIIARELSASPKVLIAMEPTRGLDVGATEYVRNKISQLRTAGAGVLLISSDLEEILNLSDRVLVMSSGEIVDELDPSNLDETKLGLAIAGSKGVQAQES